MTTREVLELIEASLDDSIAALRKHPEKEWAKIRTEQLQEALARVEDALISEETGT
jgi:hypothetical protein